MEHLYISHCRRDVSLLSFLGLRMKKFDGELGLLNKRNVPYGKLKRSYLDRTLYMRG